MSKKINIFVAFLFILEALFISSCSIIPNEPTPGEIPVSSVAVIPTSMALEAEGETGTVIEVIHPLQATNKKVTWSSDDVNTATVSEGVITPLSPGITFITVKTDDGNYSANCAVTVSTPERYFTFDSKTGTITDFNYAGGVDIVIPPEVDSVSVKHISDLAITDSFVSSVIIPDGVITIGMHAFSFNSINSLVIPDSITIIGESAFMYNELNSVVIGNSVITIGEYAFYDNQLTSITVPESVISIGASAFAFNQLTSITIGNNININNLPQTMGSNTGFKAVYDSGGRQAGTYHYISENWIKI